MVFRWELPVVSEVQLDLDWVASLHSYGVTSAGVSKVAQQTFNTSHFPLERVSLPEGRGDKTQHDTFTGLPGVVD